MGKSLVSCFFETQCIYIYILKITVSNGQKGRDETKSVLKVSLNPNQPTIKPRQPFHYLAPDLYTVAL